MAFQKSLVFVALVVVLGFCQQVKAFDFDDIDEAEIEDAIETLYSQEELSVEETEKLLLVIDAGLSSDPHMRSSLDYSEVYQVATTYLAMCHENKEGKYDTTQEYFDRFFDTMIGYERRDHRSPSILNYLEHCEDKRSK